MNPITIVFYTFLAAIAVQIFYQLFFFARMAFVKEQDTEKKQEPVSIILCARNEADNLLHHLPLILAQDYPEFEVIVVNDCSFDETQDVIEAFKVNNDNFKLVELKETNMFEGGKKFALTLGIKAAKYENLLLTDADCVPKSKYWLKESVENFTGGKEIILGYGAYEKKSGLLNKLIRFDTFSIAQQYLTFAMAGIPYMGVGRNMGYKKGLFFKNRGFASHQSLPSGDDDLFINEVATSSNTQVVLTRNAHTVSKVKSNLSDWLKQKRRHLRTAAKYKWNHKLLLTILPASYYLMVVTFAVLLMCGFDPRLIIGLFLSRYLIQIVIFKQSMSKLEEKDLLVFAPFLEFILMLIYPNLTMANMLTKPNQWRR